MRSVVIAYPHQDGSLLDFGRRNLKRVVETLPGTVYIEETGSQQHGFNQPGYFSKENQKVSMIAESHLGWEFPM